jgi:hypothetical protein
MQREATAPSARVLGIVSYVLAVLGLAFYWWLPLGMVFSISGLAAGFIGWVRRPRRTGLAVLLGCGMLLAVLALGVDLAAVWLDLVTVRFSALR